MPRSVATRLRFCERLRPAIRALSAAFIVSMVAPVGTAFAVSVDAGREIWVEVRINAVACPDFALLRIDPQGGLFVRAQDVRAWRLKLPSMAAAPAAEEPGAQVRIDGVAGLHARLDTDERLLSIDAAAALFAPQFIHGGSHNDAPERGMPAIFMDYDLFAERGAGIGQDYSALVELGSSLGRASFTSSWLASRVLEPHGTVAGDDEQSGWHRLDTALIFDWPEYTARLTLGDSVTSPGTLGQSVRFSGAHWATDFATRPSLTPYAMPVVSGTATLPSSIELYVNQALVQRTAVDAGPFQLNNIPVPVGQGAVDIRMRDILGQEQQLSVPYLVSPQLISAGLTTFDFATGAVREDYGLVNFAYGRSFLSAGMQHGLTATETVNASAEATPDQVTVRGGGALRVTPNITAELTPAVSRSSAGTGAAVDVGLDSLWRMTAVGVHFRNASPDFVELGSLSAGSRLHTEWAAQASTQFGRFGSLAILYGRRRSYDIPTIAATTLSYNISLRHIGSIGAFVSQTHSGTSDVTGGITFTRYLGKNTTTSVTAISDNGASTLDTRIGRPAPPDSGWGWDLAHARGMTDTDGLRVEGRSPYGTGSGEIDSTNTGTLTLLAWQGGLLWTGSRPWLAQTLAGPAALVELPDLGNVEVLHDGQPVGRTDMQGRILVTALRPFEDNTITLVPEDLPLSAMVDSDSLVVRPYSHGVVRAVFPVTASDLQTLTLRVESGEFVPAGAELALGGHLFPVGTQGLVQIPATHAIADAVVSWPGGQCRVRLHPLLHSIDHGIGAECKKVS